MAKTGIFSFGSVCGSKLGSYASNAVDVMVVTVGVRGSLTMFGDLSCSPTMSDNERWFGMFARWFVTTT